MTDEASFGGCPRGEDGASLGASAQVGLLPSTTSELSGASRASARGSGQPLSRRWWCSCPPSFSAPPGPRPPSWRA